MASSVARYKSNRTYLSWEHASQDSEQQKIELTIDPMLFYKEILQK